MQVLTVARSSAQGSRRNRGRKIDGVLLLDKPDGMTSNAALQVAKRLFDANKAGHTGSLDPLATGVLPLCFGEATKFSQYLLDADKQYRTRIKLGVTTDSGDADGQVTGEAPVPIIGAEILETALAQFRGVIEQVPSMFSALKVNGQPLYKLARQGIEIERKSRKVTIFELLLEDFSADEVQLRVTCSKGTYIRTIAEDLGKVLGCGAHVIALRRLAAGPFDLARAVTLAELEALKTDAGLAALDDMLLPAAAAVSDWPAVELPATTSVYFKQGQSVQIAHAPTSGWVRIFSEATSEQDIEFLGVGEILEDGRVTPRRLVATV
jgi:tRNA pseudouridine55 synthase